MTIYWMYMHWQKCQYMTPWDEDALKYIMALLNCTVTACFV